jgi:drug/metabolite transporter (DMT)-like permease
MLAAFLTAGLWTIAAVSATRGSRLVGSVPFNLVRLLLALLLLAAWAHGFGSGLVGAWVPWFVLSGVIGFGLGDMAGYTALRRVGSRLSMLIVHCLAMPCGALIEWLWLGTTLTLIELSLGALILFGVALASVLPKELSLAPRDLGIGIAMSALAALGQAVGAVTSRKAYALAELSGSSVDAGTATYQRTIGGVAVLLVGMLILWQGGRKQQPRDWKSVPPWVLIHTLSGPVVGVACFQWALSTTPAGVVLPVLATIPLLVIPLAYLLEGERPTRRAVLGGVIAVGAAGLLAAAR